MKIYIMKTPLIAGALAASCFAFNSLQAAASVSAADQKFIMAASQGGMLEVKLGEIAKEKGATPAVKEFGGRMVIDHGKANNKLMQVGAKDGVMIPSELDAKHRAIVARLGKLSGNSFDQAYLAQMLKAHEQDAAAFQEEIDSAESPDVKGFAKNTLPVVKTHLKMLKEMVGGGKRM